MKAGLGAPVARAHDLVEIEVENKKPSYVAGMLNKRIQARGLELKATAISDVVYLEKA